MGSTKDSTAKNKRNRRVKIQITRMPDNRVSKVSLTEEVLKWHHDIQNHVKRMKYSDIFDVGDRIFHMDVVDFPVNPDAESVTTLLMVNISAMVPAILFSPHDEDPPKKIFDNEPWDKSDWYWSTNSLENDNFLFYLQNVFHPWLIAEEVIFPVVVFFDDCCINATEPTIKFCNANQIILLTCAPTKDLQPLASFVSPQLQEAWTAALVKWNNKNKNVSISHEVIALTLKQVFEDTITGDLLKEALCKCGMFPFDPTDVYKLESTCPPSKLNDQNVQNQNLSTTYPFQTTHRRSRRSVPHINNGMTTNVSDAPQDLMASSLQSNCSFTEALPTSTPMEHVQHSSPPFASDVTLSSLQITQNLTQGSFQRIEERDLNQLFQKQFDELLGPLLHEFKRSGKSWVGSVENTGLYEVWQCIWRSSPYLFQPTRQPTPQEIDSKQLFRMQFAAILGPLVHEFNKSGNAWTGAAENTTLFELWKQLQLPI